MKTLASLPPPVVTYAGSMPQRLERRGRGARPAGRVRGSR